MLTQHIALVPEGNGVNASDLARVSAALQKQVVRDLAPLWGISATVDAFPTLEDVPVGYWPIVVTFRQLGAAAGVRIDRNGQPYALVEVGASWSLHASRACLEMLVNPSGNRSVTTASPRADQGPVELLVEVCGACDDARYAYVINDVLVADFCTPAYYGTGLGLGHIRYTFTAAATAPFELLPGGHLTWYDPVSDSWWLRAQSEESVVDTELGAVQRPFSSVRELAIERAPRRLAAGGLSIEAFEARMGVVRQHASQASQYRSHRLRAELAGRNTQWQATIDVVHTRQDVHVWPLSAAPRIRESSPPAAAESKVFEKNPSKLLSQDAERQRVEEHFELLMESLQDVSATSSEEVEAEQSDEPIEAAAIAAPARSIRPGTEAPRSNPPPLPGTLRGAPDGALVEISDARQAAVDPRAPSRVSLAPVRPRTSAAPAARPMASQAASRRMQPEPSARAMSPAFIAVLVACACLALGWGASSLFTAANQRTVEARAAATSAPVPAPAQTITPAVSAATLPPSEARPAGSAEHGSAVSEPPNGTLEAARVTEPAPSEQHAAAAGHAPAAPQSPERKSDTAVQPAVSQRSAAAPGTSPAQDLVASTRRRSRTHSNSAQASAVPASPSSAAASSGGSLDDLIDSRR